MAIATVTLSIVTSGQASGQLTFAPPLVTLLNPIGGVQEIALSSGDNNIPVPAGTKYVAIVPPPGNSVALKLKGSSGDTGIVIDPANPGAIPVSYPLGGTLVLNAASAISQFTQVFCF